MIDFLFDGLASRGETLAIAEPQGTCDYAELHERVIAWTERLAYEGIDSGAVVSLEGDYGIETVSAFLALLRTGAVIVPLSRDSAAQREAFLELGQVEWRIIAGDVTLVASTGRKATHPHYLTLGSRKHPGLVLFSSGSTGQPKAAVHDLALLLKKFQTPRHA